MEFFDLAFWILCVAVTIWLIQIKSPNSRFKIRISVVLLSVALFPAVYAIVYPGAYIAVYMGMLSPIFLLLAAVALFKEQEKNKRQAEPAQTETTVASPSVKAVGDDNLANAAKGQPNGRGLVVSGAIFLATAIYSYVSTLIGCPNGPNTGGSVVAEGEIQYSGVVNGMSCFWAVPLSGFWGVVGGLAGATLLILGIVRLRARKR